MIDIPDMSHMTPEKWAKFSHDERMWIIQFARIDQKLPPASSEVKDTE